MSQPNAFWSSDRLSRSNLDVRPHQPEADEPYGRIGPAGMMTIRLLISVSIALSPPGVLPKKSGA